MDWSCFPVLSTDRLLLRDIALSDAKEIYMIYSDPKVSEFDSFSPYRTIGEARDMISSFRKEFQEGKQIRWGIATKADNRLVGTCEFMSFDDASRRCEIGCGLMSSQWSKGYMREALEAIIAYGFSVLDLNRIKACILSGNGASVRLFRKLGFTFEGVLREKEYFKGQFHNEIMMSMLLGDYKLRF